MNVELYAVTASGYRAITEEMQLQPGETAVREVPQRVMDRIKADQARSDRAQLLRDTDWTQMADASLTASQKVAMAAYRQALRDLPSLAGFPDVPWPSMPVLGEGAAGAISAK